MLLGGTPELWGHRLTQLRARECMKTSIFTLGTRFERKRTGVPKGTPKPESEDSNLGSAWVRTGEGSRRANGRPPDGVVTI